MVNQNDHKNIIQELSISTQINKSVIDHNENKIETVARIFAANDFLLFTKIKKLSNKDTMIAGMCE